MNLLDLLQQDITTACSHPLTYTQVQIIFLDPESTLRFSVHTAAHDYMEPLYFNSRVRRGSKVRFPWQMPDRRDTEGTTLTFSTHKHIPGCPLHVTEPQSKVNLKMCSTLAFWQIPLRLIYSNKMTENRSETRNEGLTSGKVWKQGNYAREALNCGTHWYATESRKALDRNTFTLLTRSQCVCDLPFKGGVV